MEVSPTLAHDTAGTIAEAERLWSRVARPNVMIKIPGTTAGLPAITHCLSHGINVNVTLLFAVRRYREVVDAFFAGLEQRLAAGHTVIGLASVASFFVSRVDGKVGGGSAAIANAAVAYQAFEELFETSRWESLAARGAMVQRPLWASTSTKDPKLPDVYYVEALIAPLTVNTLPPATFAAYRDHGNPQIRIREAIAGASRVLDELARAGLELDQVTRTLEYEGVKSFAASFESLLKVIEQKAAVLVRPACYSVPGTPSTKFRPFSLRVRPRFAASAKFPFRRVGLEPGWYCCNSPGSRTRSAPSDVVGASYGRSSR
jgi:transaldolase